MFMRNPTTGNKIRNHTAMYATMRKGGIMHDRRQDRGGASNEQKEYLEEYLEDAYSDELPDYEDE